MPLTFLAHQAFVVPLKWARPRWFDAHRHRLPSASWRGESAAREYAHELRLSGHRGSPPKLRSTAGWGQQPPWPQSITQQHGPPPGSRGHLEVGHVQGFRHEPIPLEHGLAAELWPLRRLQQALFRRFWRGPERSDRPRSLNRYHRHFALVMGRGNLIEGDGDEFIRVQPQLMLRCVGDPNCRVVIKQITPGTASVKPTR